MENKVTLPPQYQMVMQSATNIIELAELGKLAATIVLNPPGFSASIDELRALKNVLREHGKLLDTALAHVGSARLDNAVAAFDRKSEK